MIGSVCGLLLVGLVLASSVMACSDYAEYRRTTRVFVPLPTKGAQT